MRKPDFLQGRLFYILQAHRKALLVLLAVVILAVGAVVVISRTPGDAPSSTDFDVTVLPDGSCAITAWKGSGTSVTIPAKINGHTVTVIEDNIFLDNKTLTSVTLPKSLTTLGDYAFANCEGITAITLPDRLTELSTHAFYCCKALTSIRVPGSVKVIGNKTFFTCASMTEVILEEGVETIGDHVFAHCVNLETITLPRSLEAIGDGAFWRCFNLTLRVPAGSWAEGYCKQQGLNYQTY